MNILVTGGAGFIGFHVAKKLLEQNKQVVVIDNINNYYDKKLKKSRLLELYKIKGKNFSFHKVDITNFEKTKNVFKNYKFNKVIHLAAQAGVRFSLKQPREYINSNIIGFFNILELSRLFNIKHLVYASSSSVYGESKHKKFKENQVADHPIQLYAATKRSNEIMAHSYSALYNLPTTGLRFFTVYGPWGRPDMALFNFTKKILTNKKIQIFNNGNHSRDFTYIDDIANAVIQISNQIPKKIRATFKPNNDASFSFYPYKIYNIGCGTRIPLMKYISLIEKNLQKISKKIFLPKQKGDIADVLSCSKRFKSEFKIKNFTKVEQGVKKFIDWYRNYYKI